MPHIDPSIDLGSAADRAAYLDHHDLHRPAADGDGDRIDVAPRKPVKPYERECRHCDDGLREFSAEGPDARPERRRCEACGGTACVPDVDALAARARWRTPGGQFGACGPFGTFEQFGALLGGREVVLDLAGARGSVTVFVGDDIEETLADDVPATEAVRVWVRAIDEAVA